MTIDNNIDNTCYCLFCLQGYHFTGVRINSPDTCGSLPPVFPLSGHHCIFLSQVISSQPCWGLLPIVPHLMDSQHSSTYQAQVILSCSQLQLTQVPQHQKPSKKLVYRLMFHFIKKTSQIYFLIRTGLYMEIVQIFSMLCSLQPKILFPAPYKRRKIFFKSLSLKTTHSAISFPALPDNLAISFLITALY